MDIPQAANSPSELRNANSFDSKESRPTSPHNVSSPRWANDPHTFLAVPDGRSRGNSVDSGDIEKSQSLGGDTYVSSPAVSSQTEKSKAADSHNNDILSDEEALRPDPGTEADFVVEDNKFAFSPGQLAKLYNPKNLGAFHALGGLAGLEKGLRTDKKSGLSNDEQSLDGRVTFEEATGRTPPEIPASKEGEHGGHNSVAHTVGPWKGTEPGFADRKRVYRDNRLPEKKSKTFWELAWIAYKDKILLLLTAAAVISLALGLYQTFGVDHGPGAPPQIEWVEGVAIVVAIVIVVLVGALNDWQKERQFVKLNKKKEARTIKVIRSGVSVEISVYDVLVGDVVMLEPGDLIPVDGVFIEGHNVKCDESSATGESDLLKKTPADEVFRAMEAGENLKKMDPFILSGAKVQEGVGTFLVTAVGVNSSYGKTMMSLRDTDEVTPLQAKLNKLAESIAKLGGSAALLLFVVLLIRFLVNLKGDRRTPAEKGQQFMTILIQSVTIVVVAVPEGLPLAVTLALAFAMTRMVKENNLVRVLRSCETMGNATTICSDKTGTLTQNKMTVVAGTVGTTARFGDRKAAPSDTDDEAETKDRQVSPPADSPVDDASPSAFTATLNSDAKEVLKQSIIINSTAFEGQQDGQMTFVGSKTETALLTFARDHLGMESVSVERSNANIVQLVPFDSGRKCMAAIVKLSDGTYRMYVKGASEILLAKCDRVVEDPTKGTSTVEMSPAMRETVEDIIDKYASRSLRTIALLYRDFAQWPPKGARPTEDDPSQAVFDDVFEKMVFLGVVGIQDPLRPGVRAAVEDCQMAGVYVRMVTGDNIKTAKAIAEDCGIYKSGGLVLEGPVFRTYSKAKMEQIIPKLCVLARSSPEDKRILVKRLKEMGETVAVTGDGTNDAPALKTADVGFSMGIAGTEVAKEASEIILMDDNFSSIVKAIMWGRAVNDAVRKFLQFQLTVNITAVFLAFITAVASPDGRSVLTAVQLLWVNLIMDTFAALALATDPPTRNILDRKPTPKAAALISLRMWKMIIGQAIFQLVVTFVLHFAGPGFLGYEVGEGSEMSTLVFNTFVWMQIFNEINNRRLDNKFNILEGLNRNWFFIVINCIMVGGQVMIIYVGGAAFSVRPLNGVQWAISIVLGALSIPMGMLIRTVPDSWVSKCIPERLKRKSKPSLVITDEDQRYEWNPGMVEIREELAFVKRLRGGRLNALKFKLQHPREALIPRSRSGSKSSRSSVPQTPTVDDSENSNGNGHPPATPDSRTRKRTRSRSNSAFGPAAAMAGIVAGSIAGWSPIERREGDNDSMKFSRNRSKSDLEAQDGTEVHPDTKPSDPVVVQNPREQGVPPSQTTELTPAFGLGSFGGQPSVEKPSTDQPSSELLPPKEPHSPKSQ